MTTAVNLLILMFINYGLISISIIINIKENYVIISLSICDILSYLLLHDFTSSIIIIYLVFSLYNLLLYISSLCFQYYLDRK